ncbi:putative membrane protein [Escherichia coli 2730450]|nr:putative membrane protein [Escherichia coli 2730450]
MLGDLFLIGCVVLFIVNFWEGGCFYFSEKQFKAAITLSGIAGGWGTIMILCMDR